MPIVGVILIFLYIVIMVFSMLAGSISVVNGVKYERLSLIFRLASWVVVIALGIFVFQCFPPGNIEYCLLAICLAVFVEKIFYMIIADVAIIKKYGAESLDGESEVRELVLLVIVAVLLLIGVCFTVIKISG